MHGDEHVCLCFLKSWLPMNNAVLPKLLEITFEVIFPGRQQHDQRYTKHPTVVKFLSETTTMPLDTSKHLQTLVEIDPESCQGWFPSFWRHHMK